MKLGRGIVFASIGVLAPAWCVQHEIRRLETKYPPLKPEIASTRGLRTSKLPNHHTPHVDVFGAKVPANALTSYSPSPHTSFSRAWALCFFDSPILRREAWLIGSRAEKDAPPGPEAWTEGQPILNGLFTTLRREPVLVGWTFPPELVSLVRKAASWGYPWRFMSGGRHEWTVGDHVDGEGMIEVRFGSAHDYEIVPEERHVQKTIPRWTSRLHTAYARWLLDERVEMLRQTHELGERGKSNKY